MMNTKVLESWGEEEPDMGNGVGGETASLGRLRSKSMSRGLPKKASRNAGIIKVTWILFFTISPHPQRCHHLFLVKM